MKNLLSILIALSVVTSAICAGLLFKEKQNPAMDSARVEKDSKNSARTIAFENNNRSATKDDAETAAAFSWRDLQTDDLKEFIRRLRAVNCPEPTIQDLILAEVNRRYGKKERGLWPDRFSQNAYWKPYKRDPAEAKKNREMFKQERDLQKEKRALLVELLGVDIEKQHYAEEGIDASSWGQWGSQLAFLPEEKRDAVQNLLDNFNDKEQDFYASVSGGWDDDARKRQHALEQEKFDALGKILTPDELRQYELRNSQTANQLISDLHGVPLTEQQYETLYDIRAKYGDSIYNWSDANNDPDTIKQIEQNKKDMESQIAGTLGAEKFAELQRAQDYNYMQLTSMAAHYGLPADTAAKIYDEKQSAEDAAKTLRSNTDLTPEQKQAALQQIRTETETAVKSALGDKAYKGYQRNGGWWLNNIAPSPPTHVAR